MSKIKTICLLTAFLFALSSLSAQTGNITGTVSDKNGQPVQGVAVIVKGTTTGTTTDPEGHYSIRASQGSILEFSFIGYMPREVTVGNESVIDITLAEAVVGLDEVVVVGYGTQSRRTVTSAISKVGGEALQDIPINSVGDGLKGKIAGVHFYTTNNTPGADPIIRIRGGSSINRSNEPLVLVDGIERDLSGINPNDIASVDVLKDAASSAIYGSRASNGVVLITTKRGTADSGPRITFEGSWALQQTERTYEFLNAQDYISYVRTAVSQGPHPDYNFKDGYSASSGNTDNSIYSTRYLNPGEAVPAGYQSMPDPLDPMKTLIFQDNSFVDEVFQNALWQNYYIGLDGGTRKVRYTASMGYTDDAGVAVGTNFSRFSARSNADVQISDRLKFTAGFDFGQTLTNAYASQHQVISRGLYCPPTQKIRNADGTPTPGYNASTPSPLYYAYLNDNDQKINKLGINGGLEWEIIDGLKANATASLYTSTATGDYFTRANKFNGTRPSSSDLTDQQRKKLEAYLSYTRTFGNHSLSVMAGYSYQDYKYKYLKASAADAISDKIPTLNAGPTKTEATTTMEEQVLIGYFGRVNYDYKKKYLLTLTFREDGSSLFASGNQWGFFPGASAGWVISEEPCLKSSMAVSNLKLRVSYGQTGNNAIGLYDALGQYGVDTKYNGIGAIVPSSMTNPTLTWETTTQLDAGVDVGFLNQRIQLSADYFNKVTDDLLFNKTLPNTSGFGSILTNVGKVRFSGFDIELNTRNINTKNFSWDSRFIWSYVKNEVVKLPDNGRDRNRIGGYTVTMADGSKREFGGTAEGEPLYRFYGYQTDYIIETMEQADNARYDESSRGWRVSDGKYVLGRKDVGDYEWKDFNGDGRINGQDMFYMGTTMPHSTGGFGNTFAYKNFTLNIYMDWALGHSICDQIFSRQFVNFFANNSSLSAEVKKTWQKPGDKTKYARFSGNDSDDTNRNFRTVSNVFTTKADYLCLREISLQYNVPAEKLKKLGIYGLAVTLSGNNLHYFTKVKGISPETGTASTYSSSYFSYPPIRRFSLGVKLTF